MPACVGATGAAAQRDPIPGQILARRVVVDGVELLDGERSTVATVDSPLNDGDTVAGVTANLRSTSVWRDGLRFWAGIFTFGFVS